MPDVSHGGVGGGGTAWDHGDGGNWLSVVACSAPSSGDGLIHGFEPAGFRLVFIGS
jgi:hypothetical protein